LIADPATCRPIKPAFLQRSIEWKACQRRFAPLLGDLRSSLTGFPPNALKFPGWLREMALSASPGNGGGGDFPEHFGLISIISFANDNMLIWHAILYACGSQEF
jgi:hypothetical protein